jgi:heme exporter protein D
MRTRPDKNSRNPSRAGERGIAVILMLIFTLILLSLAAANVASLRQLQRELKLVDQRQVRRLQQNSTATNSPFTNTPVISGPASQK